MVGVAGWDGKLGAGCRNSKSQTEELGFYSQGARKIELQVCVLKVIAGVINLEGPGQERQEAERQFPRRLPKSGVCTRRKLKAREMEGGYRRLGGEQKQGHLGTTALHLPLRPPITNASGKPQLLFMPSLAPRCDRKAAHTLWLSL